MKKRSIFLIVIACLLGLGILLTVIGIALGGAKLTYSIQTESPQKIVSSELNDVSLTDTTDIQNLNLDISASKVEISTGSTFSVKSNYLTKNEVKDGTWYVESKPQKHFLNIFGRRTFIPFLTSLNEEPVVITIPENITLQKAKLDFSAVDASISQLNCDTSDIDLSAGELKIGSINARTADFDISAGDMNVKSFHISEKTSLDCSMGNIQLGNNQSRIQNSGSNVKADCSMGSITIFGKLLGSNHLCSTMGSVNAKLTGSRRNYQIKRSHATMGDVKQHNATPSDSSADASLFGTLQMDATMGDVTVYYH